MKADTLFVVKILPPFSEVNRGFCFDEVLAQPRAIMNLFEFLFGHMKNFGFCFGRRREKTAANIYKGRFCYVL